MKTFLLIPILIFSTFVCNNLYANFKNGSDINSRSNTNDYRKHYNSETSKVLLKADSVKTAVRYQGSFIFSFGKGVGEYKINLFKLSLSNGFCVSKVFSLGLATDFKYYFESNAGFGVLMPNMKVNAETKNSPILIAGVGYTFRYSESTLYKLGPVYSMAVGGKFGLDNYSSMIITIGFESQAATIIKQYSYNYEKKETGNLNAVTLNLGFIF